MQKDEVLEKVEVIEELFQIELMLTMTCLVFLGK
jgi:hypothetical protein